jgi:hypothetical protein
MTKALQAIRYDYVKLENGRANLQLVGYKRALCGYESTDLQAQLSPRVVEIHGSVKDHSQPTGVRRPSPNLRFKFERPQGRIALNRNAIEALPNSSAYPIHLVAH